MEIKSRDRDILQKLATRLASIAKLPVQTQTRDMWARNNDLYPGRPMVYIYQIPWHEMNYDDELTLQCEEEWARGMEQNLRRTLYQWDHMRGDMVVEPVIYSPLVIRDTGILEVRQKTIGYAQQYEPQIRDEGDIEKIRMPEVAYDEGKTRELHDMYRELFGKLLTVELRGRAVFRFAPWDELVRWTGVQPILQDLALRPDYVHRLMDRLTRAHLQRLRQYEELDLIAPSNNDCLTGDGGLGYTEDLPCHAEPDDPLGNLWGAAAAQIFSEVSPAMHEEFALRYENQWLDRFGLVYYGCCEPLHTKLEILKETIPRLRKISCSPWADVESFARQCGRDYVLSLKPSPAVFTGGSFNTERARGDLLSSLEAAGDCNVEVIMKDISTVGGEPERLWRWADIASEVVEDFS